MSQGISTGDLLLSIVSKMAARFICQNGPQPWPCRCEADRDPIYLKVLEGEHCVGLHQHDTPVFSGTLMDIRAGAGVDADHLAMILRTVRSA